MSRRRIETHLRKVHGVILLVLFSFSIPSMIDLIKTAKKHQTTRIPRKPKKNGEPAYKVGDKVQFYYRSRIKASCDNCLNKHTTRDCITGFGCDNWTNFFGESEIIDIIHYHHGDYKERGHEVWMGYTLSLASKEDQEAWAKADGFNSWKDASSWFAQNNSPMWADVNLDVIIWSKEPIIKRWQPK
ncbi:MAG TPA: hypothetical protein VJ044_14790 [Candidatus Hodarchaeales archaeon]|nr:hypothetical protein [Candidatus Hodarchaeales archaeon]